MAMRDEVKEQQQKLKGKSVREKLEYFWDYYKVHTIVVLFAAFAIGIFIKDMMNTETAKKMAGYRQAVMEEYLEEFVLEWEGEK